MATIAAPSPNLQLKNRLAPVCSMVGERCISELLEKVLDYRGPM